MTEEPSAEAPWSRTHGSGRLRGRRSIRVGYDFEGQFHPVAALGVLAQGDLFVAPVDVGDGAGWNYGIATVHGSPQETRRTPHRPKLTWHRSGEVSASLSQPRIERVPLMLRPLTEEGEHTLWLSCMWPTRFTQPQDRRTGDESFIGHGDRLYGLGLRIKAKLPHAHDHAFDAEMGPLGLHRRDPGTFLLSLEGYDLQIVLEGTFAALTHLDQMPAVARDRPGITVAAHDSVTAPGLAAVLWSAGQPGPIIGHDADDAPNT